MFHVFQFSRNIPCPTVCFLIFHIFQYFSPYFTSYSMCFSFFTFSNVSCHIPHPTVYISHYVFQCFLPYSRSYQVIFSFSLLLSFLAIFQDLKLHFSFFKFFTVSRHYTGPTVCVSHFPRFAVSHRNPSAHLSFFTFFSVSRHISCPNMWVSHFPHLSVFSPYSRCCSVCFSFSTFFTFIAILQVLKCAFPIFHFFECFAIF